MNNIKNFPYDFDSDACKTCKGQCCRGQAGYIWVKADEIKAMTEIKQIDVNKFSRQFLRRVKGRLSLQERIINNEYFCCLFDPADCKCTVYGARPKQCRTYPFWKEYKKNPKHLANECPGVSLHKIY